MPLIEKPCPICGGKLVIRENKQTGVKFVGCARFPDCYYRARTSKAIRKRMEEAVLPGLE